VFLSLDVGALDRVHAGKVAVTLFLEPVEYVAIDAKMNGGFALRHDDPRALPKIVTDRRCLRRLGAGFACAAGGFSFDRAKANISG
jgi:hypothetical protein